MKFWGKKVVWKFVGIKKKNIFVQTLYVSLKNMSVHLFSDHVYTKSRKKFNEFL